jgi:transcription termination factor NusB
MSQKSAKDLAFEKERAKYRKQIRELEYLVKSKDERISSLEQVSNEKDEQLKIQNEWIERLLKYTELSKEDLEKIIKKDKEMAALTNTFVKAAETFGLFSKFGV